MSNPHSKLFEEIATVFNKHGFKLYMVGGTSRDFLLGEEIDDYDFATDATPDDMRAFLPKANYRFSMFGTITFKIHGQKVEVTTLRQEGEYRDLRHPSAITFVREPEKDYVRRDFTVNALYIDENYRVLDFCQGLDDLKKRILRMIGDPQVRFKEDPLRMYRALRFIVRFGFKFDLILNNAMTENAELSTNLNPDKIAGERRKVHPEHLANYDALCRYYKLSL
ncbi:MAG: hypothetical protein WC968_00435 [Bacilli bacterium]|jgi:tRNA nucleotidyltransferase/poly(A) polymerase